jgi:hypothetical protein
VYTYPGDEALASDTSLETLTRIKELEGVQNAGDAETATREAVEKFYTVLTDGQKKLQKEKRKPTEGLPTLIRVSKSWLRGTVFSQHGD